MALGQALSRCSGDLWGPYRNQATTLVWDPRKTFLSNTGVDLSTHKNIPSDLVLDSRKIYPDSKMNPLLSKQTEPVCALSY